jgi:uncharacterized membrane protein YhaH (DUF805 family)
MAFFTTNGRLRRRAYFLRIIGLYAASILIYALPGWLYVDEIPASVKLLAFAGLVMVWYLVVVQVLLRLHDLNLRAWWALIGVLPLAGYVLGTGLQFVQGTVGPNRFGLDPKRPMLLPEAAIPTALPPSSIDMES